jgi:pSer/pThr/pTyr-binding forkhead associated (FHA) protein
MLCVQLFLTRRSEEGKDVQLSVDDDVLKFGRGAENSIRTIEASASRKHFEITKADGNFFLEDVGSNAGSFRCSECI